MIKLHVLASGSGGNAAIVENGRTGEGVLVDCGICKRDFFARAEEAGFDVARLRAVLITHDHGDHTKGLGVVLRGLAKAGCVPAVRTSSAVWAASRPVREAAQSVGAPVAHFVAGDRLELAGLRVRPFRTSHDAAESFGFRFDEMGEGAGVDAAAGESIGVGAAVRADAGAGPIDAGVNAGVGSADAGADAAAGKAPAVAEPAAGDAPDSLGFMTDTGIVTDEAWEALAGVRLLALECNHDVGMLETGPYPYVVKQRIASHVGHLSNDQAREALARLAHPGLRQVVAMHVSQENNTYRLPRETFEAALYDGPAAQVSVAFQNRLVSIG